MNYLNEIEDEITDLGFGIISKDFERPWGGFLVIDENQSKKFITKFFKNFDFSKIKNLKKLSPKLLIIKPKSKLSWQYHNRRSEIWKIIKGKVGVAKGKEDVEPLTKEFFEGDYIFIEKKERHRLIGLNVYCLIAEIWVHIDQKNPSNEMDIIRLKDEYNRT